MVPGHPSLLHREEGFLKFEDVEWRHVKQTTLAALEVKELVLAKLQRKLIGDEYALRSHGTGDAGEQLFSQLALHDGEGNARNNVIGLAAAVPFQRLRQVQRIPMHHRHPGVPGKLLHQMLNKMFVQLDENKLGGRAHPAGDLPGVASFTRPEFDDHPGLRKIHALGRLAGQKRRTRHEVAHLDGVGQQSFEKQETHGDVLPKDSGLSWVVEK